MEARVLGEFRSAQYLAEALELAIVSHRYHQVSVVRLEGLVGDDVGVPVAQALARDAFARWGAAPSPSLGLPEPFSPDPYAHARRATKEVGEGTARLGGEAPVRVELELAGALGDPSATAAQLATAFAPLGERVRFAYHRILSERGNTFGGRKIYSLSDAYANAVACTYFSTYEGFGNAFLEGVLARRPVFVNNYKPVFWPDIGSKGFKVVMLEENELTDEAVAEVDEILHDGDLRREIAEHNFKLGREHFSFDVLEGKLAALFNF